MATTKFENFLQEGVWRAEWPALANGEDGDAASLSKWPSKSVQVIGAGGVDIEGSNDGVTWAILDDATGSPLNAATMTGGIIKDVLQNTAFIRPANATGNAQVIIIAT